MPNHMLTRLRTPLLVAATVGALAMSSAPALAGTDGACASAAQTRGEDTPCPVATPVAPVATPVPPVATPVPVQPTPAPVQPAPVVKPPVKAAPKKPAKPTAKPKVAAVQAVRPVVPTPTFVQTVEQATVPQGGIQAGAGGMAPQDSAQLPLALAVPGLLLALLTLGGAMRVAQVRSRR